MLKDYLINKNISVYKLAKESKVPYSTVNDLVNHKIAVDKLKSGQLYSMANTLNMPMDSLYRLCLYYKEITSDKYNISAKIAIEHKKYYLLFDYNDNYYEEPVISVKQEASAEIETLAKWKLDEKLSKLKMEETYESLLH